VILAILFPLAALADGIVRPPRDYKGSLEEKAQEAIIIFRGTNSGEATEDLILKVRVAGEAKSFGWVIPFPNRPEVEKEDARLFQELFDYVQARRPRKKSGGFKTDGMAAPKTAEGVVVLSRKIVGNYDVAVVRENEPGTLNAWLEDGGFQTLHDAEDVLGYYRDKGYVYACVKVSDAALEKGRDADLHPLRFTFKTGGRDGIYFPMKMTGLQTAPFDVNLYVFYRSWVNEKLNRYGYVHRGFALSYRDWDTRYCKPNAGKTWSSPETDPFLRSLARRIPTVKSLFQRLDPGERFYLTNITARGLKPEDVRRWKSDLWLFPHYRDRSFTPHDVRRGGPARDAYPDAPEGGSEPMGGPSSTEGSIFGPLGVMVALLAIVASMLAGAILFLRWQNTPR
jgi:hypothetical protein